MFAYPFIGKWNNTDPSITLDDYDYQDIQNLRRDGDRLKGVRGHIVVNSTSTWDGDLDTYIYPTNGFHYYKTYPATESHVLVCATDSADENLRVYQNTTTIPNQGEFSASILYTAPSDAETGRFSMAPNGFLAYADGQDAKLWGGDEFYPLQFITSTAVVNDTITKARDFSTEVFNKDSDTTAYIGGGNDENTILLVHFDGVEGSTSVADYSDSAHSLTLQDDAHLTTDQSVFGGSSMYLDGDGDYLSVPDSNDFWLTTNKFTLDFWVRWDEVPSTDEGFYSQATDGNNYTQFLWDQSEGSIVLRIANGGVLSVDNTFGSWTPTADTWYHIALIRGWGGAANDWAVTVNGVQLGSTLTSSTAVGNYSGGLYIGGTSFAGGYASLWMDEVRLTSGEARWEDDFTPPSTSYVDDALVWLVGSPIPLTGVTYALGTANTVASTMDVKEYQITGWETLSISDSTDNGPSLGQDGLVSWSRTGLARLALLQEFSLYWYQFSIDDGAAEIYSVTAQSDMEDLTNIYSGEEQDVGLCYVYNGAYDDYTPEAQTDEVGYPVVLDSLTATTQFLQVGFSSPQQALVINMVSGKSNSTANTGLDIKYRSGGAWVNMVEVYDGTSNSNISLRQSGVVKWLDDLDGEEFPYSFNGTPPLYWYRLVWDANMDSEVEINNVRGVPVADDIGGYTFPVVFGGRLFLMSERNGSENKAIYSAYGAPWVFNGTDSGELYFGDGLPTTAAAPLYNIYLSTGVEQLIVTTARATYRLEGTGPSDWAIQTVSGVVGCTAPLSMVVCGPTDVDGSSAKRQVVMFVGSSGVYLCDGAKVDLASHDIRSYWDPNHANYISPSVREEAVGWYDPTLDVYKLVMGDLELEYSLRYGGWTKLYRENGSGANPLRVGFPVVDTDGGVYTYGAADDGLMYRLEYGGDWNGVADINQYVHTKDMFLATGPGEYPFFYDTVIDYVRLLFADRGTETDTISFTHYCDGVAGDGTSDGEAVPGAVALGAGPVYTTDCWLGPCHYHSFIITADTSASDGMELQGLGLVFDVNQSLEE
jgi:hypothetical protein